MKDKLLPKSPFQKISLLGFVFMTSFMMAINPNTKLTNTTDGAAYASAIVDKLNCEADAGAMTTNAPTATLVNGAAQITATPDGNAVVPEGFNNIYVLTSGQGLVIVEAGPNPSFEVNAPGLYTIHSLVYDPATLDLSIIDFGVTTGFNVFGLILDGGGKICASLDVPGALFKISAEECTADAGTMSTDMPNVSLSGGSATITAMANGNAVIPDGYVQAFVLTQGEGLVILDYGFEPSFNVTEAEDYTIHSLVLDTNTLDVTTIEAGVTTGFDVFGLLIAGGGDICASLDVAGAEFKVFEEECTADAGTMSTDMPNVSLSGGSATITAMANGNAVIPDGYVQAFVLTQGEGLVILDYGFEPSFNVTEAEDYTIHSLVLDTNTLDVTTIEAGVTTGFDVFGLLIAGGGDICASLDVAGAEFKVFEEECTADAGTMSTDMPNVSLSGGSATITAMANGNAVIPDGYVQAFVLTQGEGLVILDYGFEPSFNVTEAEDYTIHSLVLDTNTLDVTTIEAGVTTGFDVFGLLIAGGGDICASLDVAGAEFKVFEEECTADAGTMSTDMPNVSLSGGSATITAMANGNAVIPDGYVQAFVLTQGEGLVILDYGFEPSFNVTEAEDYTIHSLVLDTNTLDVTTIEAGVTTGFDVFGLLIAGGGDICASLDVAGAEFKVFEEECTADAGTMSTDMPNVSLSGGSATITAMANGNAVIPDGYVQAFVLTQGEGLVILDYGFEPSFNVTEAEDYTIHSLVLDTNTLDVTTIEAGVTTGFDVFGLLIAGGGDICASLDVAGAEFKVFEEECTADAGTMSTDMPNVSLSGGSATITAMANGNAVIPDGYVQAFVLTQGEGLVILDYGFEPSFNVTEAEDYTIHSLVLDTNTLDVTTIEAGVTTGFDVFGLLVAGGGDICASLDVAGAEFKVLEEECTADSGTMSTDMPVVRIEGGTATITAMADGNAVIPDGYAQAFVLTQGEGLVILDYGFEPTFNVTEAGDYTIHSLVLDPNTLDVTTIEAGVTTGFDVFGLLIAGGGDICASLNVAGASFEVKEECLADSGTMSTDMPVVRIEGGTATITAMADGNAVIPDGYAQAFVLTQGEGLVILDYGFEPTFNVTEAGDYTIHSLVLDPNTLDVTTIEAGVTTGFDVFGLLIAGGGDICASLDVAGASFEVKEECLADSGTMSTDMPVVRIEGGTATITAMADGNAVIPDGYAQAFVLTQGEGLVILDYGFEPTFNVTEAGDYTIHSLVLDPNTLDVTTIEAGVTTGFDVFGLLIAGGGDICASLDVAGASFEVKEECLADAGTMSTDMPNVSLSGGTATLTAMANGNAVIPEGYVQAFVLTQGEGLVILDYGFEPTFNVTEAGDYTIHSLVLDPNTLDVTTIEAGVTTGFDVFGLLIAGGGEICASLDVAGAEFKVSEEQCTADAGTMYSNHPLTCLEGGSATISAEIGNEPNIPDGYQQIFVLTRAWSLTILEVSTTPEFTVNHPGFYRIHSLVYNPATLDLTIVEFGSTTGFDVLHLVQQNDICASLDVHGALNLVTPKWVCYFFNSYRIGDETALIEGYMESYDNYQAFEDAFKKENLDIKVYPNPAASFVRLETEILPKETVTYTVVDVSGRVMLSGQTTEMNGNNMSIDLRSLKDGTYFVKFESKYRSFSKAVQVKK